MKSHLQLTDVAFEEQFANCKLAPSLFSHEAHLRLAWIHITKYGVSKALENIQSQLISFVIHAGENDKYNKTLTIAAIKAVYHFTLKAKSNTFKDFIIEFPSLQNNFRELMKVHYSTDIFTSKKAKTTYIIPDLLPFDC